MSPPATGTARRATVAPQPRPSTRRPPLRVFEPEPRRSGRRSRSRRGHIWLAVALVVGSLLAVVVGDALVAQGQVRMADLQNKIGIQEATQKTMQSQVAQLAAPDRVVAQGIALGLTAPSQVLDLPQVPLDKPLPVPQTAPVAGAASPATAATTPAASTPAASTPATATTTPAGTNPAATTPAATTPASTTPAPTTPSAAAAATASTTTAR